MRSITVKAPAKINLFLDVLNKRPDGYHNIVTIFQRIALYDTIKVKKTAKYISLLCDSSDVPSGKNNIVYKAAKLMRAELGIKDGLDITLKKRIPVCAGLGGGSSDAAAVIKAINLIFNLNLSPGRLRAIAANVGADVPFFLTDESCAIGRGVGERLRGCRAFLTHMFC
ncbi:MAG: 4-(cytidine 5'-diphospho)-2-C-methyl-D-erythritol kinase [Candidatus Omnitrophota bacterium]